MRGGRGLRIATAGVRTGFAMTLTISEAPPTKSLAEFVARRRGRASPLRTVQKCGERDDVGIVPYGSVRKTAVKRGVEDAAPYGVLSVSGV